MFLRTYFLMVAFTGCTPFPFFVKEQRSITLSQTSWLSVYSLDLDEFRYDLRRINTSITYLKSQVSRFTAIPFSGNLILKLQEEIDLIEHDASLYQAQVDNLLSLTTISHKARRGLFNAVGTVQKCLFGTVDDDDRQEIFSRLGQLDKTNDALLNTNEAQIHVLADLDHRISNTSKVVDDIIAKAKTITGLLISTNMTSINSRFEYLTHVLVIQSAFREILLSLGEAKFSLLDFTQALQESYANHLSYNLVSPGTLLRTLLTIQSKAKPHLVLPYSPLLEFLPSFYQIIKVHTLLTRSTLQIVLHIPLVRRGDHPYNLFQIYPIPVFHPSLNRWLLFTVPLDIIGINNVSHLYFLSSSSSFDCSSDLCSPDDIVLRTFNHTSCSLSIIRNDTSNIRDLCKREVFASPNKLIIFKVTGGWIFSTSEPVNYTLACPLKTGTYNISSYTFNGTGLVSLDRGCSIHSDDYVLYALEAADEIRENLISHHNVSLSYLLSPDENITLSEDLNITMSMFDNLVLHDKSDAVELSVLLQQVKIAKRDKLFRDSVTYGGPGLLFVLVSCLLAFCLWKCRSRRGAQKELTIMLNSQPPAPTTSASQ
ncbi:hypothetical protein M8J77_005910 [Diaphorina citri]|nr:hypothetical protein M8J77_005910 [Diaphorina citri]